MQHVVFFSGGISSWGAAKRVAEQYGTDNLILLFSDTKMEDEDLYRFLDEAAVNVGGTLVKIADGRTPWEVFRDVKFLGNSRIDPCSRILKRELSKKWIVKNCKVEETVLYLGIDWTEQHRYERAKKHWEPWVLKAPLCEEPIIGKDKLFEILEQEGIRKPRLYEMGMYHNNCGGFCVKAGQGHFAKLMETMPELYKFHEEKEEELRKELGKDVSILVRDRKPLTLRQFRKDVEKKFPYDKFEFGGCGCFSDVNDDSACDVNLSHTE
jgi:hypothetical protein